MSKRVNSGIIIVAVIIVVMTLSGALLNSTNKKIEETVSSKAVEMTELTNTFVGLQERLDNDKEFEKEYNTFISELQKKREGIDKKYARLDSIEETEEYVKEVRGLENDYLNWCKEKGIIE